MTGIVLTDDNFTVRVVSPTLQLGKINITLWDEMWDVVSNIPSMGIVRKKYGNFEIELKNDNLVLRLTKCFCILSWVIWCAMLYGQVRVFSQGNSGILTGFILLCFDASVLVLTLRLGSTETDNWTDNWEDGCLFSIQRCCLFTWVVQLAAQQILMEVVVTYFEIILLRWTKSIGFKFWILPTKNISIISQHRHQALY